MQTKKKFTDKLNLQTLIVSLCIMIVCICSQRMQSAAWNSGIIEGARDMTGIMMALIIFTNYRWRDFSKYKLPYILWTVIGLLLGTILTPMIIARRVYFLKVDTIIVAIGIFLMGYCVIHTIIGLLVEKFRPQLYKPLFIVWVVMLLLMIFSRSEYLWPECYFVMFLCYYLTERTPQQRVNTIKGIVNGIILGFIVIQGHALLCRPYDIVRYQGNFCNPNHNCMFLCMCLAAILAKILILTQEKAKIYIRAFFFLLSGACYSLILMTGCRSGYLTVFVITIFFLIGYCVIRQKKILTFIGTGILLVGIFVAMLPLTYLAVRYVPTIHPHVVFYYQEKYSEERVHSWDPRDSEKFVSFEKMITSVLGRYTQLKDSLDKPTPSAVSIIVNEQLRYASTKPLIFSTSLHDMTTTPLSVETDPDKIPALTYEEATNAFLVRYTIFEWYFTHLSLRGMPYDEQGFQLTKNHWIQDTHNIYLDYGINFGIPVIILFTVFIWWGIGHLTKQAIKFNKSHIFACLLFALVPPVFGLFEFSWGAGMISTVAFYLAFDEIFQKNIKKEEKVGC